MKKDLLTIALLFCFTFSFSQASLVKDIMSGATNGININTELFKYNDKILFKSFGGEVAVSDGTNSGTEAINIGNGRADPEDFTLNTVTNEVYFSARGPSPTDLGVRELWKTNGFASGTSLAYDFSPFSGWASYPTDLCENNGVIYCSAQTPSSGYELGYSDGTVAGSSVIQIDPTPSGSHPENLFSFNGKVYFSSIGPTWYRELCVSDGTAAGSGLLKDINIFGHSIPNDFIIFNNKLYFTADDGTHGRELWVTDGTSNGTQLVVDVNNGPTDSNIQNLTVFGNKLYFSADSSSSGNEIHYLTASGNLILYKDINPGIGSSNPSNFKAFNGQLYFNADNGSNGTELWRADGSIFGIGLFKDINSTGSSNPSAFQAYNGNLYFSADDGTTGGELWMTDGTTSGTILVADINSGATGSEPRFLTVAGDNLLFHANDGINGRELWKYIDPTILSINDSELTTIKLYPNPTNSSFKIESLQPISSINIYDVQGKTVKTFDTNEVSYNIDNLQSGLYFVNIKSNNGNITKKLIKK